MAISRQPTGPQDGDYAQYSRTHLEDMINNFMIAYIGMGKVLKDVPRHEVAFWMQRTIQEFSYDIFQSERNIELELGPSSTIKLPNDFVSLMKVTWIDAVGTERIAYRSRQGQPAQSILQDNNYEVIYDNNGDAIESDSSITQDRFQNPAVRDELLELAQNYYSNQISDYNYSYYNDSYYGRQFGASPEEVNVNGTYLLDLDRGLIIFDYLFQQNQVITIRYLSDGIGDNSDLANVFVPKMAEDAVYSRVLYDLAKLRPSAAGAAGLYKKEAFSKMRNAKIRLLDLRREEVAQYMRAKSKWIKH